MGISLGDPADVYPDSALLSCFRCSYLLRLFGLLCISALIGWKTVMIGLRDLRDGRVRFTITHWANHRSVRLERRALHTHLNACIALQLQPS